MRKTKDGFILFYTFLLLIIVSIFIYTINTSSNAVIANTADFTHRDQILLWKYSLKKADHKVNNEFVVKTNSNKSFRIVNNNTILQLSK